MIDAKAIRANPDAMREAVRVRKVDPEKANVDRWLELDGARRELQSRIDGLNGEKKELAKLGKSDPDAARQKGQELRERGREMEQELEGIAAEWQEIMDWFPNWPHPDMPEGMGEEENIEEKAWIPRQGYLSADKLGRGETSGEYMPKRPVHAADQDFKPLHHAELGIKLGGIDTMQGGQVSGSRFAYLRGDVALMQYALSQLLIDELLARGYEMFVPPLLVRERALYGTSHFPEGRDQVYGIKTDNVEEGTDLFLVGSSEPTNFSYFMDRTLDAVELPTKVFAYTACFRSEAGSWGKDVKGIKRVHQFDKIEMNAVCLPEQSEEVYEEFGQVNEWLLQQLELPYRIVDKCHGDAGYLASHRQRDLEVWMSGSGEFMEVMTDTNATDYQARRLNIRYKGEEGRGFCHLVNDTGCAMGRLLISILDNYQQPGGVVKVPEALQRVVKKEQLEPAEGK
ncbi:MAG: serine--tRNA ligase [Candidatus Latescibacterota bacterium]|nr:serine--tRNA ligase [Candidatus Latescibacterota bacterium]